MSPQGLGASPRARSGGGFFGRRSRIAAALGGLVASLWAPAAGAQEPDTTSAVGQETDSTSVPAPPPPRSFARTSLQPGPTVTVGQPITIVIEVLVPTFFQGAPGYPELELKDALALFVFRGINFTERIDGQTWAGQSREYQIYPQRPGEYEIPTIPVGIRYRPPGGRAGEMVFDTASPPPIQFEAVLPEEAEGLEYFISALDVRLEETLDVRPDTLLVGESLERTVTATVRGALSMVIPPFSLEPAPGLAAYETPAVVEDMEGFGVEETVGSRVETVTYVAESEGRYRLPGVELQWWDVTAGELRSATLAPVEVQVLPNPELSEEIPLPEDSLTVGVTDEPGASISITNLVRRWGLPAGAVILLGVVGVRLWRRYRPRVEEAWRRARHRRVVSEAAYFNRFQAAARSGDPRRAAAALVSWLDRSRGPGSTVDDFLREAEDDDLREELRRLDETLYGPGEGSSRPWSGNDLLRTVAAARRAVQSPVTRRSSRIIELGSLNPR